MEDKLLESLFGLGGVLLGAIITWYTTRRADKRRNAIELYAQFTSAEMERVRHEAGTLLRENASSAAPATFQQMHSGSGSVALAPITRLLQFWEKVFHLLDLGYVDAALTQRFLRGYFHSHYQEFLCGFADICLARPDDEAYLRWTKEVGLLAKRWDVQPPETPGTSNKEPISLPGSVSFSRLPHQASKVRTEQTPA